MYITDATHFKGALLDEPDIPKPAREMAKFIYALIGAGLKAPEDRNVVSKVPCMAGPRPRRWCLGLIKLSRNEDEILWECPECGKAGVIRNF
ncbi:hypothetical protein ACFL2T_05470 [Elusimicrobiota bacterium]